VKRELLELIGADAFTVYRTDANGKELTSFFRSGPAASLNDLDLVIPYSPTSPAGFVALNHRPLFIPDVRDAHKLQNIHPQLAIGRKDAEIRGKAVKSMIVVPVKNKVFLGVLQVQSLQDSAPFSKDTFNKVSVLSHMLARLFESDLQQEGVIGPYDKLIQAGKISRKQFVEISKRAFEDNQKIPRILKEDYDVSEDEIGNSLEHFYRVPYMKYEPSVTLPPCFMEKIERKYLKNNLWVPVAGDREKAVVLIDDPSDQQRIFEIDKILNARSYVFKVGLPDHILKFLEADDDELDGRSFENVFKDLEEHEQDKIIEIDESLDERKKLASSSAIIQLTKRIIIDSVTQGASDIHIEPGKHNSPGIVRIRVDGDCKKLQEIPRAYMGAIISRIKVISNMDISERRLPQDGKCIETIRGRKVELRVTTYPTDGGESAVMRILSRESVTPLEKLNFSEANLRRIKELTSNLHGMLLVVGPTGVGKTVTLHAILQHLNKDDIKIWTAEDPIEITQPGLQQIQVKPKIGLTFASAMRSFLRGDPDVILVGEMRDRETAGIAIEGSLTGHLVLSTMHSNSATETITRLLNLGMDPVNFSDALLGIMSQRLVKTLCKHCKESYKPDDAEIDFLIDGYGRELFPELDIKRDDIYLQRPVGCDKCEGTGYAGRIAIHELLAVTLEIQKMIYNQSPQPDLKEQAIKDGMRTLKQDGILKILMGLTDYKQLYRVVTD
jgi:type II secretory ATPase GspE/PulE/Tfp pilus assembly ATPase PilB-like protein